MTPTQRSSRTEIARGTLAFAVLLGLLVTLSGCGTSDAKRGGSTTKRVNPGSDFGHFAGYVWRGRLTAVSASWSVPRVLGGSGVAGSWIGAQAPGKRGFIQVGTNEEVSRSGAPNYAAFWTDKTHHFLPIELFEIRAGDRISASLKLVHSRWHLEILDASSGAGRIFEKSEEGRAAFSEAEWLQEDVTNGTTTRGFAYPRLSPVAFRRLAVDSRAPSYDAVRSTWMSVGAVNFAPTPLQADAFTVVPEKISAAGSEYLRIAKVDDDATEALEAQLSARTKRGRRVRPRDAIKRFRGALERNAREVAAARWPKQVEVLARGLSQAALSTVASINAALRRGSSPARILGILYRSKIGVAGLRMRRALRVPESVP